MNLQRIFVHPLAWALQVLLCWSQMLAQIIVSVEHSETEVGVEVTEDGVGPNFFLPSEIHIVLVNSNLLIDLLILTHHKPKYELQLQEDYRPIFSFKNNVIISFFW